MNGTWIFMFAIFARASFYGEKIKPKNAQLDANLINRSRATPSATIIINISSSSRSKPLQARWMYPSIDFHLSESATQLHSSSLVSSCSPTRGECLLLSLRPTTDSISLWPITFYGAHNHFITNWSWTGITVNLLVLRQAHKAMPERIRLIFCTFANFNNHCLSRQSASDHRRR